MKRYYCGEVIYFTNSADIGVIQKHYIHNSQIFVSLLPTGSIDFGILSSCFALTIDYYLQYHNDKSRTTILQLITISTGAFLLIFYLGFWTNNRYPFTYRPVHKQFISFREDDKLVIEI